VQDGTAYSITQYNEVIAATVKALPRALDGTNPKHVIRVTQSGKKLEEKLRRVFAELLADYPFSHDMAKKLEWELVEDAPPLADDAAYLNLKIIYIPGYFNAHQLSGKDIIMQARAEGANLGQADAEHMLDNPEVFLPAEDTTSALVFPGTIWRSRAGREYVPYISKIGNDEWHLAFHPLEGRWTGAFAFRPHFS
jgi:hypothetical protein